MPTLRRPRPLLALSAAVLAFAVGAGQELLATCGVFTDVPDGSIFCSSILQVYYLGITSGTSATTYNPSGTVTREQMAAFLARTYDRAASRPSRRAALAQWWTTQGPLNLGLTTVGSNPQLVKSDGVDVWVANATSHSVSRVRGSDGKLLENWTGALNAFGVLSAMGMVFVTGSGGSLYRIDPTQAPGGVTTITSNLGNSPQGIAFDGARIWTANADGSVSIVTPGLSLPWSVTTVTGFGQPADVLYDGANVWLTDQTAGTLVKLDSNGGILQTVTVGSLPNYSVFDGTNIWVPLFGSNSVAVVRASSGAVLTTLTGNGLNQPEVAAFDGQRVLVTNFGGNSVSLWKAADLAPLGSIATGGASRPIGACSDGINFWIALSNNSQLARF
jgi:hypothetical protein